MSYSSEVLADSPLAYWRLGDASGTTMVDSSGNARDGAYSGSPTLGTTSLLLSDADTAVTLNGSTQYASVADAAWMDASSFTVEALIKPSAVSGNKAVIGRDGNSGSRGWNLYLLGNKLGVADAAVLLTGVASLSAGTTYHVAMTYDGTTIKLYLNGALDNSVNTTTATNLANQVLIGASQAGSTPGPFNLFPGVIDEVAYYGSALTVTRLAAHYAAATATPITVTGAAFAAPATFLDGNLTSPVTIDGTAFASPLTIVDGAAHTAIKVDGLAFASAAPFLDGFIQGVPISGEAFGVPMVALGGGVPLLVGTDTSNALTGRRRGGLGTVELDVAIATPPSPPSTVRVDKAIALPVPVLVKGRPT